MKIGKTERISCRWLNAHSAVRIYVGNRYPITCYTGVMQMSDISDMVDNMLQDFPQQLRGFVAGDCLYLQEVGNDAAWIEGKAVNVGDWQ